MTFIALLGAFAVYCLYASAASLRDRGQAHVGLGDGGGAFPTAGVVTAALSAPALFVLPELARGAGYPGAAAALVAVSLPVLAAPLVVRAWGLARLAGARGVGELLAHHYGTTVAALAAVFVLAAATVLLAHVFTGAGRVVAALTAGAIDPRLAASLSALFLALTAAPAGIRAGGAMARVHAALVALGLVAAVWLVVAALGGGRAAVAAMGRAAELLAWGTTEGRGGGDYPAALAVAGALQLGSGWSAMTVLSVQGALACALLVLVWMPWSIAAPNPRALARPLAGTAAGLGGALSLAAALILGLAALTLQPALAPGAPQRPVLAAGFASEGVTPLLAAMGGARIWIGALFGVAAAAALHAFAASLVAAAVGMARPLWGRRLRGPSGSVRGLAAAQGTALAVTVAGAVVASAPAAAVAPWSDAALTLAALVALPLAAMCRLPGAVTAQGLAAGLAVGAAVAILHALFGGDTAIHGALPALAAALVTAAVASALRPRDSRRARRSDAIRAIAEALARTPEDRLRPSLAWLAALAWMFFAIGPGIVIGNDLFGAPDAPRARWEFGVPSIAVWQLLSWVAGVVLVWALARGLASLGREEAQRLEALSAAPPATRQTDRPAADR